MSESDLPPMAPHEDLQMPSIYITAYKLLYAHENTAKLNLYETAVYSAEGKATVYKAQRGSVVLPLGTLIMLQKDIEQMIERLKERAAQNAAAEPNMPPETSRLN